MLSRAAIGRHQHHDSLDSRARLQVDGSLTGTTARLQLGILTPHLGIVTTRRPQLVQLGILTPHPGLGMARLVGASGTEELF